MNQLKQTQAVNKLFNQNQLELIQQIFEFLQKENQSKKVNLADLKKDCIFYKIDVSNQIFMKILNDIIVDLQGDDMELNVDLDQFMKLITQYSGTVMNIEGRDRLFDIIKQQDKDNNTLLISDVQQTMQDLGEPKTDSQCEQIIQFVTKGKSKQAIKRQQFVESIQINL